MTETAVKSTCWECSALCGSVVHLKDGAVTRIDPNPEHPGSRGAFCIKGIRGLRDFTTHEQRLTHPVRRTGPRGGGGWERVSWDDTFAWIAARFARIIERDGAEALVGAVSGGFFSRGPIVALLMRAIGSPNWMINQDLCGGCRAVSDRVTGLGIVSASDIENTRTMLMVGRNPTEADPIQWRAVKDAKARGARLVVIDPVRTQPARMADLWLAPRLGTDAALGLAMMQVIIEEGLHDAAFIAAHCTGYEALAAHVRDWTPARAAAVSGVPAEDIRAAARLYADGPSCFISGHGIDAFSHGVQTYRAFHCLLAITGNLDRVGGNRVVRKPDGFRSYLDLLHDPAHRLPPDREALTIGSDRFPLWSGPDAWQKACHNPSVIDAIMTGRPYPVRGLYASGVNIAVTYPDSARTIEALKRLDTFVVAAQQMNPTAELADLVLPKTTGLEEEEIAIHPTGRCLTYTAPVMPPRGEAKPDVEIAAGILAALRARGVPLHDVFPWTTQRQFLDDLTVPAGLDLDALRRDGYLMIDHLYEQPGPGRRRTPSGKVELYSSVLEASGYDPLPAPPPDDLPREDAAFPLLLVTGMRERTYHHSRLREQSWARKVAPDPWCKLHPETAARMGIGAGDWLRVETAAGACRLRAELSDQVPANAVTTGMGWWLPEDTRPGKGVLDVNVNAALSYQGPYDPVSGSSNVRGVPCRLTVIAAAAE